MQLTMGDKLLPIVYHHQYHLLTQGHKETAAILI